MHLSALVVAFAGFFADPKEAGILHEGEPLHHAAYTGHIVQAHVALLRCPKAVNAPRKFGKGAHPSPVHIAADWGHVGVLKLLIANGGDLNDPGESRYTPLQHAALSSHTEAAELLLKHGAKLDLFSAVRLGKEKEVRACFALAAKVGMHTRLANSSMRLGFGQWRLLNWAIAGGNAEIVELLLRNGAEVNSGSDPSPAYESPPLHDAIQDRRTDLADLLLRRGAKVDAQDYDGYTALHRAVARNDIKAARFLLEHGASVETTQNYHSSRISDDIGGDHLTFFTPLHTAAKYESPAMIALLLKHGAPLAAADAKGRTPLDVAVTVPDEWDRDEFKHKPGKLTPARALCIVILIRAGAPTGTPQPKGGRIIP